MSVRKEKIYRCECDSCCVAPHNSFTQWKEQIPKLAENQEYKLISGKYYCKNCLALVPQNEIWAVKSTAVNPADGKDIVVWTLARGTGRQAREFVERKFKGFGGFKLFGIWQIGLKWEHSALDLEHPHVLQSVGRLL